VPKRSGLLARLCALDLGLLRFARRAGHAPALERAVSRFSRLGEHAAIWLAVGSVGGLVGSCRSAWRRATAVVAFAYLLNTAIKFTVRRPRPNLPDLPPLTSTPSGLSFPSAHTTTAVVGSALYARLGLPAFPLRLLAASLAYSRIYLGVHYPSDLVGGGVLGALIAKVARRWVERPLNGDG
jgi:membrane-associated phospholipid phosphatase